MVTSCEFRSVQSSHVRHQGPFGLDPENLRPLRIDKAKEEKGPSTMPRIAVHLDGNGASACAYVS